MTSGKSWPELFGCARAGTASGCAPGQPSWKQPRRSAAKKKGGLHDNQYGTAVLTKSQMHSYIESRPAKRKASWVNLTPSL